MPRRRMLRNALGFAVLLIIVHMGSPAEPRKSNICRDAAQRAAAQTSVPFAVLWAIAQTETGRNKDGHVTPWPWTINVDGQGYWLDTRAAALAQARLSVVRNVHSFDLGCFQINYRWHGQHFASVDQMLDPDAGASYAARFLQQLFDETGSWSQAAGAYHSRTPILAAQYRQRFDQFYAAAADTNILPSILASRENTFPLLQPGSGHTAMGSLVPVLNGR